MRQQLLRQPKELCPIGPDGRGSRLVLLICAQDDARRARGAMAKVRSANKRLSETDSARRTGRKGRPATAILTVIFPSLSGGLSWPLRRVVTARAVWEVAPAARASTQVPKISVGLGAVLPLS